jgi:arginine deiminase
LQVLTVREILSYGVINHMGARVELEEMAMTALTYSMDEGVEITELREEDRPYLSDDYKREVLQHMSIMQLIDTIMINPTVHISPSYRDTGLSASYTFQPLSNLVYTRDQQITTCKGIVMGKLRSSQRQLEVEVMKFCFRKLGMPRSDMSVHKYSLICMHSMTCLSLQGLSMIYARQSKQTA